MRIVSKFDDFYDRAQASGIDLTRVFFRETAEQGHTASTLPAPWQRYQAVVQFSGALEEERARVWLRAVAVSFCGQVFCGLRVRRHLTQEQATNSTAAVSFGDGSRIFFEERTFFDAASAVVYLSLHLGEEAIERKSRGLRTVLHGYGGSLKEWLESELGKHEDRAMLQWSIDNKVVSAMLSHGEASNRLALTLNPVLRDLEFFRVYAAYAAYQEIDMFLGGVLAPESRPMVPIADRYRVEQHGFDERSFRKPPTKRR